MIVLLALLPLQAWAGIGTSAASPGTLQAPVTPAVTLAGAIDPADDAATAPSQDSSSPADSADASPPGADFAEQLLPAPLPRMVTAAGRGVVPQYTRTALPDPDLPLLPRPPRG